MFQLMSSTDTLTAKMREHKITGTVSFTGWETAENGWEHGAYRFTLNIGDALYLGNAPYYAGTAHNPNEVTIQDCFAAILSDISSVDGHDDWAEWADDLGLVTDAKSAKSAQRDFAEIKARGELLRDAIGDDAYAELLDVAREL